MPKQKGIIMKLRILKSLLIIALASALAGGATYLLFEGTGTGENIILNSRPLPHSTEAIGI